MEVSAIMNVQELAIDREVKQKAGVQGNGRPEESKDDAMMAETVDTRINTMKQADNGRGTQEKPLKTRSIVNLIT